MARHAFADYAHEKLHRSIGEETEGIEEELFVGLGAVRITTGGAVKGVSPRGMAGFTWDSTIIPTPKQRSVLLDVAKTYKEAGGNLAFETVNGSEKYPDHGGLMREEDTDSTRAKEFARLRASLMGFAVSSGVTVARSEWPEWALALTVRGGPGSGHHKHKGIPGHRGGSAPSNLPPAEPSAPAYRQASGLRPAILILNPPRTPKYARVVSALEAIARVHGAPMANIPLVAQRSRTKGGSYKRVNLTHEPIEIGLVLGKTEALGIATVHEFGHYMDDWGLGYGFFASLCPDIAHLPETPLGPSPYEQNAELRDALDEWYEAVSQSKAAKGLERGLFNSAMATRITAADGTVSVKVTRESGSGGAWKWRNNVMQRHEYFARSYSQYIALRGGDVGLKAEIDTALREYHEPPAIPGYKTIAYTQYWEWDDFKPIASAFDKIFRSTQWASQ